MATTAHANQDLLVRIREKVKGLSREEAARMLRGLLQAETIAYYQAGALLHRFHSDWFAENPAAYEAFVLNELRITTDKAARLRRVFLSIEVAQLTEKEVKGITVSSLVALRPILEDKDQREHVPHFLDRARTVSVAALKGEVRKHMDKGEEKKAAKTIEDRFGDAVKAYFNGVSGDNLDRFQQVLQVVGTTLVSMQLHGEIIDNEIGEARPIYLNIAGPERDDDDDLIELAAHVDGGRVLGDQTAEMTA